MTKNEKNHLRKVAEIGCIVCRRLGFIGTPAEVHHIRAGQGWGRPSHFHTIPLCPEHHRGQTGVHGLGTKGFPKHYGFTEEELLNEVLDLLKTEGGVYNKRTHVTENSIVPPSKT